VTHSYRMNLGAIGEEATAQELRERGWTVTNLNINRQNYPNADLEIRKDDFFWRIQIKVCTVYAWISAGGVNPETCSGKPIFNKVSGYPTSEFIICLTPSARVPKGAQPSSWRYFVLPVSVAERAFRVNIDAYFNGAKRDGTPRSQRGACQDFVGPGPFTAGTVPDHHQDYAPYEGRFGLLESRV